MSGVVLKLVPAETKLDVDARKVLQGAIDQEVGTALVLGYTPDGEFYAASSTGDGGTLLYLLETFKHKLMAGDFAG